MTRPIDWTDEELKQAGCVSEYGTGTYGQAVRAYLAALGAVHPSEAREREREAWNKGASDYEANQGHTMYSVHAPPASVLLRLLDNRYPSLLPKSPPPLVLSSGSWMFIGGEWGRESSGITAVYAGFSPICRTASDARKLADWLAEYGSEEEKR